MAIWGSLSPLSHLLGVRTAAVLLVALVLACEAPARANRGPDAPSAEVPPAPVAAAESVDAPSPSSPSCQLVVTGSGATYSVALSVTNPAAAPLELRYHHPLSFQLTARVAGQPIEVEVPASSMPVQPRTLKVAATGTRKLSTPITLQFGAAKGPPNDDPFLWRLHHAPAIVELRGQRVFTGRSIECTGRLLPPQGPKNIEP